MNLQKAVSILVTSVQEEMTSFQAPGYYIKKYNGNAKEELLCIGMTEKDHVREQVQTHNLAKSIAEQMARKLCKTCSDILSYNSAFLGEMLNDVDCNSEIVAIEKFKEGSPIVKYMNNTGDIDRELWRKLKLWPIFLTISANKS